MAKDKALACKAFPLRPSTLRRLRRVFAHKTLGLTVDICLRGHLHNLRKVRYNPLAKKVKPYFSPD